ncbi:MAG: ABC transporter permease [Alicyclobacillus sp.]|nr:ABC transporter permease [Alicyclobacillus sp.]
MADGLKRTEGLGTRSKWLILPVTLFLLLVFVYPILNILGRSFTDPHLGFQNYVQFFQQSGYIEALQNTFEIAITVTVITALLGYPVAYLTATGSQTTKRAISTLVLLAFWTSLLVRTYAWMVLLQDNGVINSMLMSLGIIRSPLPLLHTFVGVIIGMVYTMLPFMILPIQSTMSSIDSRLMLAATSLGAKPWVAFVRIYFFLSLPGVISGCLMVFVMTLGYYITPALLGGAQNTMIGQFIADQIQNYLNWGMGATAATILFVATFILFLFYLRFQTVGTRR